MMRHVVMFRRLAAVEKDMARQAELAERMRVLVGEIDFIRDWKVSANVLDRSICWDYLLESSFDDADAVQRYLVHPAHVALIQDLKQYFEWAAVDYVQS
ncbi:Dabb family protein [Herbaspirillum sp. 1130]|uniref:Dabb family protein n=1 Tax=Herbaspirillum sp. 1130 TaxID=2806562 RepID=UPI001AE1C7D5|nr:Dabb family protein [Herbaspirillum sp. 1130]